MTKRPVVITYKNAPAAKALAKVVGLIADREKIDAQVCRNMLDSSKDGNAPVDTDDFEFVKKVGEGCWGQVYEAIYRVSGEHVAVKVIRPNETAKGQAMKREIDLIDLVLKEGTTKVGANRIVPRTVFQSKSGEPFIMMPLYARGSLEDCLNRNRGIHVEGVLQNVAEALGSLHRAYGTPFCDLKPANILMDENGEAYLSDLGSTIVRSLGPGSDLSNMGEVHTRAPENFANPERPKFSSDSYAFASLAKYLYTGEYLFQEELDADNSRHPLSGAKSVKEARKRVRDELKDKRIPKQIQKFLARCADPDPSKRSYNGIELREDFEKAVRAANESSANLGRLMKCSSWALPIVFSGALAMGLWNGCLDSTIKVDPPAKGLHGNLYLSSQIDETPVKFNVKPSSEIAAIPVSAGGLMDGFYHAGRSMTDNRPVAYIAASSCAQSLMTNSYQRKIYGQSEMERDKDKHPELGQRNEWMLIINSIENAMGFVEPTKRVSEKGREYSEYNLEEVLAFSRIPPALIYIAQEVSGQTDWHRYKRAVLTRENPEYYKYEKIISEQGLKMQKDRKGNITVIPSDESRDVDRWIAQCVKY
jgi:serine/threonine protein kinase